MEALKMKALKMEVMIRLKDFKEGSEVVQVDQNNLY